MQRTVQPCHVPPRAERGVPGFFATQAGDWAAWAWLRRGRALCCRRRVGFRSLWLRGRPGGSRGSEGERDQEWPCRHGRLDRLLRPGAPLALVRVSEWRKDFGSQLHHYGCPGRPVSRAGGRRAKPGSFCCAPETRCTKILPGSVPLRGLQRDHLVLRHLRMLKPKAILQFRPSSPCCAGIARSPQCIASCIPCIHFLAPTFEDFVQF